MLRDMLELAGSIIAVIGAIVIGALILSGVVIALDRAFDRAFAPGEQSCVVTLATGDTVTRHGCDPDTGGVLYCDEMDYSPVAWVSVTCGEPMP